jgi:NAD(P)-dependent dehydrogenase (short-subunit alcohol dehydrogenase family)
MSKVWFVTGANSGIGAGIAKAALKAGDRVVATGRNLDKLRAAFDGVTGERLPLVQLNVTDETKAQAAVVEAVERTAASTSSSTTPDTACSATSRS